MKLNEIYYEVEKYIDLIDFNKLWKGFKPLKFALYNDRECFFDGKYIEKTDNFLANTAINYNGEVIAIWNVLEDLDPIVLASKIIHEMFHGYQMINNESRFPNELESLSKYQYIDDSLSIKLLENKLIVELIDKFDIDKFNKLLSYRKYRYDIYNYEFMYELMIEQIEGSANYVELSALKCLSVNMYLHKLKHIKSYITNPKNLIPVRIVSYDIGALMLMLLKDNNISFNERFNNECYIISLLKDYEYKIDNYLCMKNIINDYNIESKKIIENTILKNNIIVDDVVDILGVNVYNARYYNHYIISTYFVMYSLNNEQHIEYGDFVIELCDIAKASKIYKI